jgi:hypothetical protein
MVDVLHVFQELPGRSVCNCKRLFKTRCPEFDHTGEQNCQSEPASNLMTGGWERHGSLSRCFTSRRHLATYPEYTSYIARHHLHVKTFQTKPAAVQLLRDSCCRPPPEHTQHTHVLYSCDAIRAMTNRTDPSCCGWLQLPSALIQAPSDCVMPALKTAYSQDCNSPMQGRAWAAMQ